jgi:WD40 repeat protein
LDLDTEREIASIQGDSEVLGLAFHPDGQRVAISDYTGQIRFWEPATGQVTMTSGAVPFTRTNSVYYSLRLDFAPTGQLLAAAGPDEQIRLFDASSGSLQYALSNSPEQVLTTDFDPGGSRLAAGSVDGTITIWDLDARAPAFTLQGQGQGPSYVDYSPDGKWLATVSFDGLTKLWDAQTGQERITLYGQAGVGRGVKFSPDGRYLAVAGTDNAIRVYLTRLDDLIAVAHERLTRTLTTEECQNYLRVAACPAR